MALQLRGVSGGGVTLTHISLTIRANSCDKLKRDMCGDKDFFPGGTCPMASKELSGYVNQGSSPLGGELNWEIVCGMWHRFLGACYVSTLERFTFGTRDSPNKLKMLIKLEVNFNPEKRSVYFLVISLLSLRRVIMAYLY